MWSAGVAVAGSYGSSRPRRVGHRCEQRPVLLGDVAGDGPDRASALLQLCGEEGGEDVAEPERRSEPLPGVLVDRPVEERLPVRALVEQDVRSLDVIGGVEHECAALAADEVLRLVEAERGHATERAERLPAMCREQAVRVVFDQGDATLLDRAGRCGRGRTAHRRSGRRRRHGPDRRAGSRDGRGRARACRVRCRRSAAGRPRGRRRARST